MAATRFSTCAGRPARHPGGLALVTCMLASPLSASSRVPTIASMAGRSFGQPELEEEKVAPVMSRKNIA